MARCIVLAQVGAEAAGTPPAGVMVGWLDVLLAVAAAIAIGLIVRHRWHRLPATMLPTPIPAEVGLVLFAAMMLFGLAGAQIAAALVGAQPITPGAEGQARPLSMDVCVLLGHVLGMSVATVGCLLLRRRAPRQRLPIRRSVLIGAAALIVLWPVMNCMSVAAGLIVQWIRGQPVDMIAHTTLREVVQAPTGAWPLVMALVVGIPVPVLEEVMYRGLLQRAIASLDLGRVTAIVSASTIFVMMHMGTVSPHALPALFLLSLGLGWVYERTGRLAAPITMHVLFNVSNLVLAWALQAPGAP